MYYRDVETMYSPTYNEFVRTAVESGYKVDSRFGGTHEIVGGRIMFPAGEIVPRRRMNMTIGWMELLQLLSGEFDACSIERVAPNSKLELFTSSMAYGPRIAPQVPRIIEALKDNPQSRQAVLYVGSPQDGPTNNQPCTTAIQFLVRNQTVETLVTMRSWDLVKGLPYDVFMFGGLSLAMSHILGYRNGDVIVQAGSTHVYDEDQALAHAAGKVVYFRYDFMVPSTWEGVQEWATRQARSLMPGDTPIGIRLYQYRQAREKKSA